MDADALAQSVLPRARAVTRAYVKKYRGDFDEVYAEALLGVAYALSRFDDSKACSFKTWADKCMRSRLMDLTRRRMRYSGHALTRRSGKPYEKIADFVAFIADPRTGEIQCDAVDPAPTAEAALLEPWTSTRQRLDDVEQTLPGTLRTTFQLLRRENGDTAAQRLGVSPSTISARLNTIRTRVAPTAKGRRL